MSLKMIKKIKSNPIKLIIIFFIISLLPFLRSCGDVSYGFPTVSIDSQNFFDLSKWIPLGFFINLLFVIGSVIIVSRYYKPKLLKNIYIKSTIYSLLVYHILYIVSFTFYLLAPELIEPIILVLSMLIYPAGLVLDFVLSLAPFFAPFFEFTAPPLYLDPADFGMRVIYILSAVMYALLGLLVGFIIKKSKPKK